MKPEHYSFNRLLLRLLLVVVATAVYGAVLAAWRSPRMAAYVAVKLPCVFGGSTLVVSVFCWMAAAATGATLHYREVLDAVSSAMAVAGAILLALSPIVLFFILTAAPDSGAPEVIRFVHSTMLLVHIGVFATAGIIGNVTLYRSLKRRVPASCKLLLMMGLWLAAFGVVGCQLGWIMRPLVGSPNMAVEFLRSDALKSNFLESVFQQIIPTVIHQGAMP